jgi:hypothetical protein
VLLFWAVNTSFMSPVYVIIRDEGEWSGREWSVEGVCSTMELALARACKVVADEFKDAHKDTTWESACSPYLIQTWTLDGHSAEGEIEVTTAEVRQRHPELEPVIESRAQAAATHRKLLDDARARDEKLRRRRKLDDQLRDRSLTVEEYYIAVEVL